MTRIATESKSIFGAITLGSDPEIFVTKQDFTPWGATHSGIAGTKEEPQKVPFGAVQVDGMALEFNIDPASTVEEWVHNHKAVMTTISGMANDKGLMLNWKSMLDFTQYIDTQNPSEDETLFGCDPDFNADTMKENVMPDNDGSIKFRTTGGHVHIGMSEWDKIKGYDGIDLSHQLAQRIVYVMDLVLGCWSVLHDDGIERKKLYGKAGAYRIKPYGVEYRTLSNFWIRDEELMRHVFNTVHSVMSDGDAFLHLYENAYNNRTAIVHCINTNDRQLAKTILESL